jgi:hypothetical protein
MTGSMLKHGSHARPEDGVCLMEAVAWVAGEAHSDHPACACPVLAAFGRQLNDRLRDEERDLLVRFVPRLVGSRATAAVERERMFALADAAVRRFLPFALEAAGRDADAARLRGLAPIVDRASALKGQKAAAAYADAAANAAAAAYADAAYAAAAYADAAYAAAYAAANAAAAYAAAAYAAAYAAANAADAADAANAYVAAAAGRAADAAGAARASRQRVIDEALTVFDELLPAAPVIVERSIEECPYLGVVA